MDKKFYTNVGSLNNIDVQILCDENEIYKGNVNDVENYVKSMMYYNIELGNPTKVYVTKQQK